jgi:hypothetical protein
VKPTSASPEDFPLFPDWTFVDEARGTLATGMQKGMDTGFQRLDAYLQTIS